MDQGLHALMTDLESHGMLDDVSIVVWGEFGRTPRVNNNAGRDHWPRVAMAFLAGGGMRTGQVIGSTTRYAEQAESRPVHYQEVLATLVPQPGHRPGYDPVHRSRRPPAIPPGTPATDLMN